jgi:hypothetical protein
VAEHNGELENPESPVSLREHAGWMLSSLTIMKMYQYLQNRTNIGFVISKRFSSHNLLSINTNGWNLFI